MRTQGRTVKVIVVLTTLIMVEGCLLQEGPFIQNMPEDRDQCVTPSAKVLMRVSPNGISTTLDGSLFGVAGGDIFLFNNRGELLWTREGVGSTYALLLDGGRSLLAESYNKEESWKSTIVKFDSEGNTLWERQTGLIGLDGLAVTPDGSYIAVGATDEQKGHVMLFDQDGNKLWDHQLDGRVETVAVSRSGYVVAGPRDTNIYVYNRTGELIFTYPAQSLYDTQDVAISPDETFFLFGSENEYLNCHTLEGEFLWQQAVGSVCNIRISADGEYLVIATADSTLLLLDRNGNELWRKKVTDAFFIEEVAISDHAEYIAINTQEGFFFPILYLDVYSREGTLIWRYEGNQPFMAIAMSGDGHYIAAGNQNTLLFFDNLVAVEEYAQSECAQRSSLPFLI